MEIPDGIYLQWEDPDCELGVTWCVDKINDDDIEYALKADLAAARAESEGYRAALEAARNALGNANFNTQGSYQLAADAMTRIAEALK